MRWAGHVACIGDRRGSHRVSAGRHEGKRPLGRPRRRWENYVKIDVQELEEGITKCQNEHVMNTIIYVSTTYFLKYRLHVST